jgi:Putative adhesin
MPTFDTPAPISVTMELGVADIRVVTSDRADTVVEVRPSDSNNQSHVAAAEQTRVEYAAGRLLIKAPRGWNTGWKNYSFRGVNESVDVTIEMPGGSSLHGDAGVAALHCEGRLGECRFKTGVGDIYLDQAGTVKLKAGSGDITVDRAAGHAEIATGSGSLRVGNVDGSAAISNSNGNIWVGKVTGHLRLNAANGEISVNEAESTVVAKSANGDIRFGQVAHGAVVAQTARGSLDIGVRNGVAAWLDLKTHFGTVYNRLDASEAPAPGEASVELRAHTAYGDITVHRSSSDSRAESFGADVA